MQKSIFSRWPGFCVGLMLATFTAALYADQAPLLPTGKDRGIRFVNHTYPKSSARQRLALVIGNSRYDNVSKLVNPANDAQDMAQALERIGFDVLTEHNGSLRQMVKAIARFTEQLNKQKGVGLIYYAGHGVQISGKNYLIPTDAKLVKPSDIRFEAIDLNRVLDSMAQAGNRLNIIILDACRDNPFPSISRTLARGLAQVSAPSGTLLAYATAPGEVAQDGQGRNGVYTQYLLKYLEQPRLSIEALFKKVRLGVMKATDNTQVPWESSSLLNEFYFAGNNNSAQPQPATQKTNLDPCLSPSVDTRPVNCLFGEP